MLAINRNNKKIMGKEKSERIQTSLLNAKEKVLLIWLANRQPSRVTSDMLTYFGVAAAVLYAIFCWLSNSNIYCYLKANRI